MMPMEGAAAGQDGPKQIDKIIAQLQQLIDEAGELLAAQQVPPDSQNDDAMLDSVGGEYAVPSILQRQRQLFKDLQRHVAKRESEQARSLALKEVAETINSSLELDQVLNQVMDVIVTLTHAERAMLLLTDDETGRLEVQVARNMDRESIERSESFQISRSIVSRVAESGDPVVTMNAQEDDRFSAEQSIISYQLRSILCVPLKIKEAITGVIYADNRIASGLFGEDDRDLLAAFANQAAVAIENAQLFREIRNNLSEITEMKDLMDNVFASVDGGVITIDDKGQIALFNRAAGEILGVSAETMLNQPYETALPAVGLSSIEPLLSAVKLSGLAMTKEMELRRLTDNAALSLHMTLSPLRDMNEDSLGVAIVIDDISQEKRLESVRRYLPPTLVDKIRDLDAAQRPQKRMLTVMFADLRGYTSYSELQDPVWLIEVVNGYFGLAVEAISRYHGFTDKFMGDAVMALFNTPLNPQEDHVQRALRTALMIQASLARYRRSMPAEKHLHFGIGVHTGEAVVGNVGSDLRKDYSAIGDAVNLAKRLQELAAPDQILISQTVYDRAGVSLAAEALEPVKVKGRHALEHVYDLKHINA